jgi:hypothetical protein
MPNMKIPRTASPETRQRPMTILQARRGRGETRYSVTNRIIDARVDRLHRKPIMVASKLRFDAIVPVRGREHVLLPLFCGASRQSPSRFLLWLRSLRIGIAFASNSRRQRRVNTRSCALPLSGRKICSQLALEFA